LNHPAAILEKGNGRISLALEKLELVSANIPPSMMGAYLNGNEYQT
jgi:hypothetical protein